MVSAPVYGYVVKKQPRLGYCSNVKAGTAGRTTEVSVNMGPSGGSPQRRLKTDKVFKIVGR